MKQYNQNSHRFVKSPMTLDRATENLAHFSQNSGNYDCATKIKHIFEETMGIAVAQHQI
jgi:hypothetical protein